jgi:hypothetical protein
MNHVFLVTWCNEGLEYVVDITEDQQRRVWSQLKDGAACESAVPNINHLILRARYNPQRHYEIYTVGAVEGITEDDIRTMFKDNPQAAADLIRERGECFYSDRLDQTNQVIV